MQRMANLIGQQLGQYTIRALLGEGGMSTVYRGYQESMQREVAVKIIESQVAQTAEFVARFEREARTVAALSHAHIVKVFDFGRQDKLIYLVMELLNGGSLATRILEGLVPPSEAARYLDQIGSALDHAHKRGVVHRDLKPGNVLLNDDGDAFLTDFGIAKILDQTTALTQSNTTMGTPGYMSPELWRGEGVDGRTDIYALGVVIFELLVGTTPYRAATPYSMMHSHLYAEIPSVVALQPTLPPAFDRVMRKVLAKESNDRYQTAGEFAAAFRAAIEGRAPLDLPTNVGVVVTPVAQPTTPRLPVAVAPAAPEPVPSPIPNLQPISPARPIVPPSPPPPIVPPNPGQPVSASPLRSPLFLGILAFGIIIAIGLALLIAYVVITQVPKFVGVAERTTAPTVRSTQILATNTQPPTLRPTDLPATALPATVVSDTVAPSPLPPTAGIVQPIGLTMTPPTTCPNTVTSRLSPGGRGRVAMGGAVNRVRDAPGGQNILGTIPQGESFKVLAGPTCGDKIAWWQVNYNGLLGWTAETSGTDYYLEPVLAPATLNTNLTNWALQPGSDGTMGAWADYPGGLQGSYQPGDDFYMAGDADGDTIYEGDLELISAQADGAAGLAFHVSSPLNDGYVVNINLTGGGEVKLLRFPPFKLASASLPIQIGTTYHLKVITTGANIKIYFNNNAVPVIDTNDSTYSQGSYGVNIFKATALFQNIQRHAR
jgi:serine/threonine-protein kinase